MKGAPDKIDQKFLAHDLSITYRMSPKRLHEIVLSSNLSALQVLSIIKYYRLSKRKEQTRNEGNKHIMKEKKGDLRPVRKETMKQKRKKLSLHKELEII